MQLSFSKVCSIANAVKDPKVHSTLKNVIQNPIAQKAFALASSKDALLRQSIPFRDPSGSNVSYSNEPKANYSASKTLATKGILVANDVDQIMKLTVKPSKDSFYSQLTEKDPFRLNFVYIIIGQYTDLTILVTITKILKHSTYIYLSFPPQIPTSHGSNVETKLVDIDEDRSQATSCAELCNWKMPPERPPPPKTRFNSDISGTSNFNYLSSTNEPNAIVKYPYRAVNVDELSCKPNDIVILKKEVDEEWIFAMNTRTGESGIVPLTFLQIQVPLVPNITSLQSQSFERVYSTTNNTRNYINFPSKARALFDYGTAIEGDLNVSQLKQFIF